MREDACFGQLGRGKASCSGCERQWGFETLSPPVFKSYPPLSLREIYQVPRPSCTNYEYETIWKIDKALMFKRETTSIMALNPPAMDIPLPLQPNIGSAFQLGLAEIFQGLSCCSRTTREARFACSEMSLTRAEFDPNRTSVGRRAKYEFNTSPLFRS